MSVTIRVMNTTAIIKGGRWGSADASLAERLNAATPNVVMDYHPWPEMGVAEALAREFNGDVIEAIDPNADDDGLDENGLPKVY